MNNIRYTEELSTKWFVAKDVCKILRLNNTTNAIKPIPVKNRKKIDVESASGKQSTNTINIEGVKYLLHNCRSLYKDEVISELKIDLDIVYDCKESSYLRIISASFKLFKHKLQYNVNKYRIDMYFEDHKVAVEVDEHGHSDRDILYEQRRQSYIEQKLGCQFIRFNPDSTNFNIGDVISEILNKLLKM